MTGYPTFVKQLIADGYAYQDTMPQYEGRIAKGIFAKLIEGDPYIKLGTTHIITPPLSPLLSQRDQAGERIFDRDSSSPSARRFQEGLGLGMLTTAAGEGEEHNFHREIKPVLLSQFSQRKTMSFKPMVCATIKPIIEQHLKEGTGFFNLYRVIGQVTGSVVATVLLGCATPSPEDAEHLHIIANSGEKYAMRRVPFGSEWQRMDEPHGGRTQASPLLEALIEESYQRSMDGENPGFACAVIQHMRAFATKEQTLAQLRNIAIAAPGSSAGAFFSALWYCAHTIPLQKTIREAIASGDHLLATQILYAAMMLRPPVPLKAEVARKPIRTTIGGVDLDIAEGDTVVEASLAEGWKPRDGYYPGLFAPTITDVQEVNRIISPFGKFDHVCPGPPLVLLMWSCLIETVLSMGTLELADPTCPYPETFTALSVLLKEREGSEHYFRIT